MGIRPPGRWPLTRLALVALVVAGAACFWAIVLLIAVYATIEWVLGTH